MKLIIDIPNELAEKGHWYTDEEMWTVIKAAQNGTPIPDNATNGEIMQMMFPNGVTAKNAPYQKRGCFRPTDDNSGTFCI